MSCWMFIVSLLRCLSIFLPSSSVAGLRAVSFLSSTSHVIYHTQQQRRLRRQPTSTSSSSSSSSKVLWSSRQQQQPNAPHQQQHQQPTIIVVGKIIVDEYGDPKSNNTSPTTITVGGGGPQAAIGAALALAARSLYDEEEQVTELDYLYKKSGPPPKQRVAFMAAVGDLDFTNVEETALRHILNPALLYEPRVLRGRDLMTPRIRLWHDDNQVLQWFALNDSFGPAGAGGLWGQLPAVDDYLSLLEDIKSQQPRQPEETRTKPVLYVISEGGKDAPGNNGDSRPLLDARLRSAISHLGVEPILFPLENGQFGEDNVNHCATLLQCILDATPTNNSNGSPPPVIISPDMAAFTALQECFKTNPPTAPLLSSSLCDLTWAVRHGPNGSQIIPASTLSKHATRSKNSTGSILKVPAATLHQLVNPTGAGNAFAAAYTALRGSGCNVTTSACLATGVGAVFCEYNHCPPYSWELIQRVVEASREVRCKVESQ